MIDAHVDGRPMPELLEPLDERRLGVAGRRRRGVALRLERGDGDGVADGERRQQRLALVAVGVALVAGLDVHLAVAGERDRRAGRRANSAVGAVGGGGPEPDAHRGAGGVGHLRGQRALPDQPVQRQLLAVQLAVHLVAASAAASSGGSPRGPPGRSSPSTCTAAAAATGTAGRTRWRPRRARPAAPRRTARRCRCACR